MRFGWVLLPLAIGWVACSERRAPRGDSTSSCLMPQPDAAVWQACTPDAALRGELADLGAESLAADSGAGSAACDGEQDCSSPAYPCVRADDGEGYACRGQYAAWPMPDSLWPDGPAPQYTVTPEDGTVLDEVTGLVWQRELPETYSGCSGVDTPTRGATCNWEDAGRYCARLRLADRRWRVPSLIELVSLLDYAHSDELTRPLLDPEAFPSTGERDTFWSATSLAVQDSRDAASAVTFGIGLIYNVHPKRGSAAVRCVGSARVAHAPPERYVTDAEAESVVDPATLLEWQSGPSKAAASFDEAAAACASSGRRVPSLKELFTLLDLARTDTPVHPLFEEPSASHLLFSTTIGRFGQRLYFAPNLGSTWLQSAVDDPFYGLVTVVRCVR